MATRKRPTKPKKKAAKVTNPGPVSTDPILAMLTSQQVTERTRLAPGQSVQVEYGGNWWAGEVLSLEEDGSVTIHYSGWDNSWDEAAPRSRLRLHLPGPKQVKVALDNGQSITGTLLSSVGEFMALQRETGAATFINKQKIVYLDVETGE